MLRVSTDRFSNDQTFQKIHFREYFNLWAWLFQGRRKHEKGT